MTVLFLLKHTHIINFHFGRTIIQRCNLVDIPYSREITSYSQIQKDEVILTELIITEVLESHLEIRFGIRLGIKVYIHSYLILIPDAGESMELAVLNRVAVGEVVGIILMSGSSPMAGTVKKLLLRTFLYAVLMAHLKDVRLSAVRPSLGLEVIAHHPECRPETVSSLRQLYG